jgi:hypothetical protein
MPYELLCSNCKTVLQRTSDYTEIKPVRKLAQLNGVCPTCGVELSMKDFQLEVVKK